MPELKFSSVEGHQGRAELLWKWLLRLAVACAFIWIGKGKFEAHSQWITIFDQIGFGQWCRYFTGILQVTGGVLVLIPRTFAIGILLLMSSMAGAMVAWIFVLGVPLAAIIPESIFAGLLFVGTCPVCRQFDQVAAMQAGASLLHAEAGQRLHQDMAVFHVQPRGFLIGCWIACEDIAPDSRPLTTLFRLLS
jgi:putative oxidoreductase